MSRQAVILCVDASMRVPAFFVAASVRRHARNAPIDVLVATPPYDASASECGWLAGHGIDLCHGLDWDGLQRTPAMLERLAPATLAKLLLAPALAERYDRILYLDADLTIHADLAPLFRLDLGIHPLAAARRGLAFRSAGAAERSAQHFAELGMTRPYRYFNAGVLLIDVAAWNARALTERCFRFLQTHGSVCHLPDEDSMNGVLDGDFAPLSPVWNMQVDGRLRGTVASLVEAAVVHYAGPHKPWRRFQKGKPLGSQMSAERLYRAFVRDSPWPEWLGSQWRWADLRADLLSEWKHVRKGLGRHRQARRRRERMSYRESYAAFCRSPDFADVAQGLAVHDGAVLRVRREGVG